MMKYRLTKLLVFLNVIDPEISKLRIKCRHNKTPGHQPSNFLIKDKPQAYKSQVCTEEPKSGLPSLPEVVCFMLN